MAAKGYTTAANVAAFLGLTFTSGQTSQATALVSIAEDVIDTWTRRGWLLPQIEAEQHDLLTDHIYLDNAPVTSVDLVQARTRQIGDPWVTLTALSDYELINVKKGDLQISYGWSGGSDPMLFGTGYGYPFSYLLAVTYTPNLPVPGDIAQAATQMVAHWMFHQVSPNLYGLTKDSSGELGITIDAAVAQGMLPPGAALLIKGRRRVLV